MSNVRPAFAPSEVVVGGRRVESGWFVRHRDHEVKVCYFDLAWPRPDGETWAETMAEVERVGQRMIDAELDEAAK